MNYTYIVRCSDGTLYTGWTNNLKKRIKDHNEGRGAKYTRSRRPVMLAYYEEFATKEEAMSREWAIKQMPRRKKEEIIRQAEHENLCGDRRRCHAPSDSEINSGSENHCAVQASGK